MKKKLLISFVALIPVEVFLYLYVDKPLFMLMKERSDWIDGLFQFITKFGLSEVWLVPSFLFFILYRFLYKRPEYAYKALFLFSSVAVAGAINMVIKMLLGRNRPVMLDYEQAYGFDFFQHSSHHLSFPSGHTNTVFAAAMVLYLWFPKYRILIFGTAVVLGLSRVIIEKHYLSDVIAGAFTAIVIVLWWRLVHIKKGWQF